MAQMTISKKSYVVGMTTPSSSSHHNERKRWCHHGARRPYASPNFVSTCPQIGGVAAIIKDPDAKVRQTPSPLQLFQAQERGKGSSIVLVEENGLEHSPERRNTPAGKKQQREDAEELMTRIGLSRRQGT